MTDDVVLRMDQILAKGALRPLPKGAMDPWVLDQMVIEGCARIKEIARSNPTAVRDLVLQEKYASADSFDRYYRVRQVLVQMLDQLDSSGELLLEVARDPKAAWYARVASIEQIGKRGESSLLKALLAILDDSRASSEVLRAIVKAVVDNRFKEGLPFFQKLSEGAGGDYLLYDRCLMGEAAALLPLIREAYNEEAFAADREAIDYNWPEFEDLYGGVAGVIEILYDSSSETAITTWGELLEVVEEPELRAFALERFLAEEPASDELYRRLQPLLSDSSETLAFQAAHELFRLESPQLAMLREIAEDPSESTNARLWSIYILMNTCGSAQCILDQIPSWEVCLPDTVPAALREQIVRYWVPECEVGTDVRWLIELQSLPLVKKSNIPDDRVTRFRKALKKAGWRTSDPVNFAAVVMQGGATYSQMVATSRDRERHQIAISDLGPFLMLDDQEPNEVVEFQFAKAAAEVGLAWLGNDILDVLVPGLRVYHFGEKSSLTIGELLFCWRD